LIKNIIVGIDPGTTTGIAIVDINGKLLYLHSKRDWKREEVVKTILNFGRPIIIATDVNPPPKSVEKLASSFGCKIFYPEISFSVLEKQELVKTFVHKASNEHEVDALAACVKAWKKYRSFFARVSHLLSKKGASELFEEVVKKLLKEGKENVESIVEEMTRKREQPEEKIEKPKEKIEKVLEEKERKLEEAKKELEILTRVLSKRKAELLTYKKIKLNLEEVEKCKKELEELKRANNLLKKFERIRMKKFEPLVELESINSLELEKLDKLLGLENRVVYCNSLSNANVLNNFGIRALVTESEEEINIANLEFPVIKLEKEFVQDVEGVKCVKEDKLESLLAEVRKSGLIKWLESYRKRKENY